MSDQQEKESANEDDKFDDAVDPRVQIELERLNTATDDINKLEVDLDEARATFRELLCESTITIDNLSRKLSACIEKSRPYYDARFKAKEALREAQKAAIRFEKANGQHSAAKEMVYLAEEGLRMEGRSFDHAWQEMLNHATERVNESEHERALSEAQHRHMTALYHNAEHNVQRLQSDLKRAITKSRPYYEMKAQFHQMLEKQKSRVSILERSVGNAKMTYAQALRNLEKISDEIHRTRRYDGTGEKGKISSESSATGSPDSPEYMSDEYLNLPEKLSPTAACPIPTKIEREPSSEYLGLKNFNLSSTEPRKYIKRDRPRSIGASSTPRPVKITPASTSTSRLSELASRSSINFKTPDKMKCDKKSQPENQNNEMKNDKYGIDNREKTENGEEWTEISLNNSPEEIYYNNEIYSDEDDQIPYKPLPSELSPDSGNVSVVSGNGDTSVERRKLANQQSLPVMQEKNEMSLDDSEKSEVTRSPSVKSRRKLDSSLANWISRSSASHCGEPSCGSSTNSSRRQSLDMLWSSGTSERVKELLSQGMMMLNISNLTERRASEPKVLEKDDKIQKIDKIELKGKKVPSPLEKTMVYLNTDEETSDSESLASVEMLSEDQISSLMMEPDMNQVCQEVLGTPLVEVCPLLQHLQQLQQQQQQ